MFHRAKQQGGKNKCVDLSCFLADKKTYLFQCPYRPFSSACILSRRAINEWRGRAERPVEERGVWHWILPQEFPFFEERQTTTDRQKRQTETTDILPKATILKQFAAKKNEADRPVIQMHCTNSRQRLRRWSDHGCRLQPDQSQRWVVGFILQNPLTKKEREKKRAFETRTWFDFFVGVAAQRSCLSSDAHNRPGECGIGNPSPFFAVKLIN